MTVLPNFLLSQPQYATNSKFVDAMEVIMALMFTSKMPLEDKVNFLFNCIDFDGKPTAVVSDISTIPTSFPL